MEVWVGQSFFTPFFYTFFRLLRQQSCGFFRLQRPQSFNINSNNNMSFVCFYQVSIKKSINDDHCHCRWGEVIPLHFLADGLDATKVMILSQPSRRYNHTLEMISELLDLGRNWNKIELHNNKMDQKSDVKKSDNLWWGSISPFIYPDLFTLKLHVLNWVCLY